MDAMDTFKHDLEVNDQAKVYLLETAKWSKFLAIVGFIFSILFIILGLFMGTFIGSMMAMTNPQAAGIFSGGMGGVLFTVIYCFLGLIYLIPCYYLYKFSNEAKLAINSDDSDLLASALGNHKSVYKFMGIMMIVVLGFYALFFVFGGLAMLIR